VVPTGAAVGGFAVDIRSVERDEQPGMPAMSRVAIHAPMRRPPNV
jgi:hypothetical protein